MGKETKTKEREIPLISFEYDRWEDLQHLVFEDSFISPIIRYTLGAIKYSIENKMNKAELFIIDNLSLSVDLPKSEFLNALKRILKHYEKEEDYNECVEIQNLIKSL
tara:strand:+ start:167 stop:487 length:321 start_codon:yes stop_codon:yes gene_type:complete